MKVSNLFTDERAVSPVVGVALLIAIAVILAAVIGAVVLGLGSTGTETPQAQLEADITTGSPGTVTLQHRGGDPLLASEIEIRTNSGSSALSSDLAAGESVDTSVAVSSGDTVSVVWQDPNSDAETVLETFTAP